MRRRPPLTRSCCVLVTLLTSLAGTLASTPIQPESQHSVLLKALNFRTDTITGRLAAIRALPASLRGLPLIDGGWLLVQFDPDSRDATRRQILESFGASVAASIPRHTLLARVPASVTQRLATRPEVEWIGRFHPGFKLGARLEELRAATRLRLILAPGLKAKEASLAIAATGARLLDVWEEGALVNVHGEEQLLSLLHSDAVLFVEEDFEAQLLNDRSRGICQTSEIGNEAVSAHGLRGLNALVAVMDSGIDEGHCCFGGSKIVSNRTWGGGQLGALCDRDHGTHVSGTVSCLNAGDHDGLAPDAHLMMQDIQAGGFMACFLGSVSPPGDLTPAWNDAYQAGARIHTNSWGGGSNRYGSSARAIDRYMWEHQDFLILFAAGNKGSRSSSLGAYSNAKNSLTIGGTVNSANFNDMYNASSRGPAGDGRMLPDLLAPAQGVSSAQNRSTASCDWATHSGTSMATPAAAGSAVLVREYYERGFYPSGAAREVDGFGASAALVKATLLISTRNMTGRGTRGPRPNNDQGFGRLTLDDALWFADDPASERLHLLDDHDTTTGLSLAGEEAVFTLRPRSTGALKLMLVWTDAPGSPSASKALVNDLDLSVTLANGRSFRGNKGFDKGWTSSSAGEADRRNNKEGIFLASPFPGPMTITVHVESIGDVARHPQDFALIAIADADPICTPAGTAEGVGNSAQLSRDGDDLRVSWADTQGVSYVVYRGDTPDFMDHNPSPYASAVQDADPSQPGVQWSDVDAGADGVNHYYLFFATDSCDALLP